MMMMMIRGVVANVLDCDISVSSNSSRAITFIFELIPLGKARMPLSLLLGVKVYHYCSSTGMALVLNNS